MSSRAAARASSKQMKDTTADNIWVQECWSLFKRHFLHVQKQCIPLRKKSSKGGKRPAWMNKELLAHLRWKRMVHGMWKEG